MKNLPKKIMSLFMVFAVSAAASSMVSATNVDKEKVGNAEEYIPITLDAEPSYIVNIPAQITLTATTDYQSMPMSVKLLKEEAVTNSFSITTTVSGSQDAFKLYYNGDTTQERLSCDFGISLKDAAAGSIYVRKYLTLNTSYIKVSDGNGGFNPVDLKLNFKLASLPTKVGTYGAGKDESDNVTPVSLKLTFTCS